jgi:uncharacterized metal-binding protein
MPVKHPLHGPRLPSRSGRGLLSFMRGSITGQMLHITCDWLNGQMHVMRG